MEEMRANKGEMRDKKGEMRFKKRRCVTKLGEMRDETDGNA